MAVSAVKWAISSRTILKHLFPVQSGALYCVCHKSTYSSLPDDYNCKVELALTSDSRTIVCYHPSVDIPYEEKGESFEQGPMIEQLSKMFFTTKHRWYPRGQYHRRRKKLNPPKDR
uniref:Large ribosomal subunit protein mL42 n=1 Tax=Molossus molossus TaxID=27622 RepID=A0A7J8G0H7_MOLMO|nr:mitochondrial ribosomal protein L42 [Molossus molossus]